MTECLPSIPTAVGLSSAPFTERILLCPGVAGTGSSPEHSSSVSLVGMTLPRDLGRGYSTQEIKFSMSQNRIHQEDGSNLF